MTPQETLALVTKQLASMERMKKGAVKVGLPAGETATSKAYKSDGAEKAPTVLEVGIWHEYGTKTTPMRSFLRGPFAEKKADLDKIIATQMNLVLENGLDVDVALGRIGMAARNISVGAFSTQGYGDWPALSPITIELRRSGGAKNGRDVGNAAKAVKSAFWTPPIEGATTVLVDTGILRNSITWVVE